MSDPIKCIVTFTECGDEWYYSAVCRGHEAGGTIRSLDTGTERVLDSVRFVTDKARWEPVRP